MKRLLTTAALALVLSSSAAIAPADAGDGLGIGLGILGEVIAGGIIQQQQGAAAAAAAQQQQYQQQQYMQQQQQQQQQQYLIQQQQAAAAAYAARFISWAFSTRGLNLALMRIAPGSAAARREDPAVIGLDLMAASLTPRDQGDTGSRRVPERHGRAGFGFHLTTSAVSSAARRLVMLRR
jgi:hypothetical protein